MAFTPDTAPEKINDPPAPANCVNAYSGQTETRLGWISVPTGGNGYYSMTYDTNAGGISGASAGELLQVTFPWGGQLGWSYTTANYAGGRFLREVNNRYLAADSAHATTWTYPITHSDTGTTIASVHADMTLADASTVGAKKWIFNTSGSAWQIGLAAQFLQLATATSTSGITDDTYTWAQGPSGNPYISQKVSILDEGTSNAQSATTQQTLDAYGNLLTMNVYPYVTPGSSLPTALQAYTNTYLNTGYVSNYIRNRLASTALVTSAGTKTLVTNLYDAAGYNSLPYSSPCTGSLGIAGGGILAYDSAAPVPNGSRGLLTQTTNQLSGSSYDLNGNMLTGVGATLAYDEANRLSSVMPISGGTAYYGYAPDNKRIYQALPSRYGLQESWTFFGAHGEKLGVYTWVDTGIGDCTGGCWLQQQETNVWFAGKVIYESGAPGGSYGWPTSTGPYYEAYSSATMHDRVGTNRENGARFYPYGDEIGGTSNDHEKFATYQRDGFTGLDYADQRYYASSYGRFNTADPLSASADPKNPRSWNRYSYTMGDPINGNDPTGQIDDYQNCVDDDVCIDGGIDGGGGGGAGGMVGPCWQIQIALGTAFSGVNCGVMPVETSVSTTSSSTSPPCWQNVGNVDQTLTDLGANILEIAETKISNAGEIGALTADIATTIVGEDQQLAGATQPPSFYVGGHFNLDLTVAGLQQALGSDYSLFQAAFGGTFDGTRQSAVYGNAAQGNYTLHSKLHNKDGYFGFHFDTYNPLSNIPIGLIQHLFGDVIGGHIGTPCLDPAWQ